MFGPFIALNSLIDLMNIVCETSVVMGPYICLSRDDTLFVF
jgi:hypothetical protein